MSFAAEAKITEFKSRTLKQQKNKLVEKTKNRADEIRLNLAV